MLSAYFVLERPKEGGFYGFPSLDWLLVEEPDILVWPNVRVEGEASLKGLSQMESEQLPVVDGELYAAYVWVHEYPFDANSACS